MVQKLRLALVLPRFGPNIVGGAELLGWRLAERLAGQGHQVEIITTCALDHHTWRNVLPPGTERFGQLVIRRFATNPRDFGAFSDIEHAIVTGYTLSRDEEIMWLRNGVSSAAMEDHLTSYENSYDMFLAAPYLFGTTYFSYSAVPSKTFLIPCLHNEPYAYLTAVREMLRGAAGLLFNSIPEAELAKQLAGEIAQNTYVGMGFEPDPVVNEREFMRKHKLSRPLILYVGRREPGKNTPLLSKYFSRYRERTRPHATLLFAGSGDPVPGGPGFVDIRRFDWSHRPALYRSADVFCQPSVNESLSIVLMQAWLAGRPAVVHADCAVTRYHCEVANGGLWFRTYAEFEAVMDRLLGDDELRNSLGESGRRYVLEEYSWDSVLKRFHDAAYSWLARSAMVAGGRS